MRYLGILFWLFSFFKIFAQEDDAYLKIRNKEIKKNQKRIAKLNKLIAKDSLKYGYYYERGYCYYNIDNYVEAYKDFKKSQMLNPFDECSYIMAGSANLEIDNYKEAIKNYSQILKWTPNSYSSYLNIANVYEEAKSFDGALVNIDMAIALNPKNEYLLIKKAYYLIQLKSGKKSLDILDTLSRTLQKDDVDALKSQAYFLIGDYKNSLTIATALLKQLDDDNNTSKDVESDYYNLYDLTNISAQNLYMLGDYKGAFAEYKKISLEGDHVPENHYYYGLTLLKNKFLNDACNQFTEAIKLGYTDSIKEIKVYCN